MTDDMAIPACPVELVPGEACGEPAELNAPFPICVTHMAELYVFVRRSMSWQEDLARGQRALVALPPEGQQTVYYVALNEMVKIGWTGAIRQRLRH